MTDFTAYLRLGVDSRDAVKAQKDLDGMAKAGDRSDKSFKQLSGTTKILRGSIGGIGLAAATSQVINYADAWTNVSNVLMGVSDSSAAYAATQAKVLALSKDTFSSLQGTAGLYSEITRSVTELGINQERVLGVTRTINNLFLAGGKAASETAGAIRQLNQGLASGALRGDEFNSVAEGAPRILDALSQKLKINKGELRAFAAEGKITAELLISALEDYSSEAQKAVDSTQRTFSQNAEQARTFALEFVGASEGIKEFSAISGSALVTVAENLDLVSDAVIVLSVAYGARLAGSLATVTGERVASIAATRAQALAENEAATGIARRATVEALAAKETLAKARAESIAATATVNSARANGIATQSVAPLITALNTQAVAQQRLTAAIGGSAAATAAASAANARLAATNAAVAGTTALATAARAAGAALSLIGGPVGVAVLAGAAIYYFATRASEAEKIVEKLNPEVDGLIERFDALGRAQQQLARAELAERVKEQASAVEDLNNKLARQQSLLERQASPFSSASMGTSGQARVSEGDLTNTRAQIEAAEAELAKLQGQFDTVKKTTAQINSEMKTFADSFGTLNELAGRFITGNGVENVFSLFSSGSEDVKKFSAEYTKLSADIEKRIALFGDERESSELAYLARTGQLKNISEQEAALAVARLQALEQMKETADETERLAEIERSRADSISSSIAELEKQNALFNDQSKYASILYDINNGLLLVTESEKARYLAAAQANDQLAANQALAASIDTFATKSAADKAELDSLIESVDEFGGAWTRTGSIVADALGGIADSLNDYSAKMVTIAKKEAQLAEQRKKFIGDPKEIAKISAAEKKLASDRTSANISSYRQIAGAAASMFDEQSKARELLNKAEQAFAAIEIALALKKAAANALTAVTNQGGGDPYTAFGRIAAMAAIMAGLGLAVSGSGGGSSGPSAADIQAGQGTGTVLGDAEGKSESIANAFENYEEIALDQLSELRGIRDAMTGLSSGIAKLAVSLVSTNRFSGADVEGLGKVLKDGSQLWGSTVSGWLEKGDFLGINSKVLGDTFGSTKRELNDSGLQIGAQDLGAVLAGDLSVFYYNTIETTKKKLFGLSKKKSTKDELTGADAALVDQFDQIFTFIGSAVTESLDVLGLESASAIESFKINIGKISFKDLSGDEIQSELNAIFSQQADLIAEFVVPAMKDYQQMGEGLFETLTRVAKETATFNFYTQNLGLNFNATGLAAIAAQQAIADFSGGMDKLSASLQSYYEEFFSEEERAANQMKLLSAELQKLGFDAVPESREAFRALVEGIDLTTAAGQKQFAALIELSGAFAELVPVTEAAADAAETDAEAMSRLKSEAKNAFDALGKSISDERARLQAIRSSVNTAQSALQASVKAEQSQIDQIHKQRMDSLNAEKTAAQALQQAQLQAINEQRQAVESNISALTSLSNGLIDTIYDLSAESSALSQMRFTNAAAQVSSTLAAARKGNLPMNGELDRVLAALTSNQGGFASAFDAEFQTAAVQLELAELAKLTDLGLSAEERSLAQLDRAASNAESYYARSLQSIDKRMAQAETFHAAETEKLQGVLLAAQAQVDAINGVNSAVASVADAVTGFNAAVADVVANDAVNELSLLDDLLATAEGQWNALQGIETGVLNLNDAMENFSRAIADANTAAGNAEVTELKLLLEEMRIARKETAEAEARTQALLKGVVMYTQKTANELEDQRYIAGATS